MGGCKTYVRKILVSVKILSAILGPEMAAPILWTPKISVFFLQENLHVHKISRFRRGGGVFWVWGGGVGSADFSGDFSEYGGSKTYQRTRSPEHVWTPPKELLVCSVMDFCTGKTKH